MAGFYRMRKISHDYFGVDANIVWQTATQQLGERLAICRAELDSLPE